MQRLGAAEHRGQALHRDADEVDLGLLGGELHAGGLGVEAQHQRLRVLRAELLGHDASPRCGGPRGTSRPPRAASCARRRRRPGAGAKSSTARPGRDGGADVLDAVGQGEGDLLHGRRPGLGHVVAGDRDGVPARQLGLAVGEDVGDQPQRVRRRVDVGAAGDVLLEHVVLDRAGELVARDAVLLGDQRVEQQQHRRRRVDRHRRRDALERDLVEQQPHVLERVDRDADLADLAGGDRVVGVVAHLRRQVEGDRQPAGALRDQVAVALVGLLGGAEAGVLPHRPRPAGVHRRVDAAGVRELPRLAEPLRQVGRQVVRPVDGLDREAGLGRARHGGTSSSTAGDCAGA